MVPSVGRHVTCWSIMTTGRGFDVGVERYLSAGVKGTMILCIAL